MYVYRMYLKLMYMGLYVYRVYLKMGVYKPICIQSVSKNGCV